MSAEPTGAMSFGSFRLLPRQRLLLHGDQPVHIGSRALDILITLVERHGQLVGKNEIMASVWPNTTVVEANLSVHVAALRRAINDGRDGNRYLVNVPGRGYRFVAPVTMSAEPERPTRSPMPRHNLPTQSLPLIGRADAVGEIQNRLSRCRLLTITGPGGVGKTAVALAAAEGLMGEYEHGVWLLDVALIDEPHQMLRTLAAILGLEIGSAGALPRLIAALKDKRMLIVFDNCERVIGAASALAASVLRAAPGVRILATSREALHHEGEYEYLLPGLAAPPASARLGAAEALAFPAVQLLIQRAVARSQLFEYTDANVAVIAEICVRLDGNPLAIELAAARIHALGVRGVAAQLSDRLRLLTGGHRTAPPRQQTMRASLDWSYDLLTARQQLVLRHLAIFASEFSLDDVRTLSVASGNTQYVFCEELTELVAKSLVVAVGDHGEPRFRLLETVRIYALEKLAESGEIERLERRRAA